MFTKNRQDMLQTDDLIYADPEPVCQRQDPANRRLLTLAILVLVAVAAAVTTAAVLGRSIKNREARYIYAQELLVSRAYEDARAEFEALGDYRDSQQNFAILTDREKIYQEALALLAEVESGQSRIAPIVHYDAAAALLEELGDYADALALLDACYTEAARIVLAEGDSDMALAYVSNMRPNAAAAFFQTYGSELSQ